jgi:hypothetical protein
MPSIVFGIEDNDQVNRDRIRFAHAQLPILNIGEAISIDELDALVESRSTEDGAILPLQVVRGQVGYTTYGTDNDGIDSNEFLSVNDPLLIAEMFQLTFSDAPTADRAFTRSGHFPQFINRQNPYTGASITVGWKYIKALNQAIKLYVRISYSIVKVSNVETVIFST